MKMRPEDIRQLMPSLESYVELLKELIGIPSPSGNEHAIQKYIFNWFENRNIQVEYQEVEEGLVNVIATINNGGESPTLLVCGHTDTALPVDGWNSDPFIPFCENERLYGLGAMDMKSGIATAMLTIDLLNRYRDSWKGTIIFATVADEEAYSRGMNGLVNSGIQADVALLCEPEYDIPLLGGVGKVLIKVCVKGKSAHGSFPERGINAVVEAAKYITALEELDMGNHAVLGKGSQCILGIQGGPSEYVIQVPESCEFTINRHIVPGETDITVLKQMENIASKINSSAAFSFTIEPPYYPAYIVSEKNEFVKLFESSYRHVFGKRPQFGYGRAVSDANYLVGKAKIPTVAFGPGGEDLHSANEWCAVDQMPKAMEVYLNFIFRLMNDNSLEVVK